MIKKRPCENETAHSVFISPRSIPPRIVGRRQGSSTLKTHLLLTSKIPDMKLAHLILFIPTVGEIHYYGKLETTFGDLLYLYINYSRYPFRKVPPSRDDYT